MTTEQIHQFTEPDPAGQIDRPELTSEEQGNVIPFPVRPEARPVYTTANEDIEQDPEGEIDRLHINYELSKERISQSIQQTREDKDREALRQASFMRGTNVDDIAERKSERAFERVEKLQKPAGAAKKIGSDVLRIIG